MTKAMKMDEHEVDSELAFDSEEAHFYHTIASFEDLVNEYGFDQILENLSDELYIQMFDFFVPPVEEEDD